MRYFPLFADLQDLLKEHAPISDARKFEVIMKRAVLFASSEGKESRQARAKSLLQAIITTMSPDDVKKVADGVVIFLEFAGIWTPQQALVLSDSLAGPLAAGHVSPAWILWIDSIMGAGFCREQAGLLLEGLQ